MARNNTIHSGIRALLLPLLVLWVVGCNNPDVPQSVENRPEIFTVLDIHAPLPPPRSSTSSIPEGKYEVLRVLDGDTLEITDGTEEYRLRMIGINCQEIRPLQPYAREALDFVESKIADAGGYVEIKYDGNQLDRSQRILAMVYLTMPDGTQLWLNRALVENGYAIVQLQYRFSDEAKKSLVRSEDNAKRAKRNLWGGSEGNVGKTENQSQ
jgi:endonuclease YncB( thermonuclease family)